MTRQRSVIFDIISSDKCHHAADEIFALAKERLPGISLATVYNTLKYLEEKKLIRKITAEGTKDRYDSTYTPHGHLFCASCFEVCDFTVPEFDKTLRELVGQEIDSYELKVRYICPRCKTICKNDMP